MKKAIMGGEMVRTQRQTGEVLGLFCSWDPDHDVPLQQSHLGYASNPLGYIEQVDEEPEFQPYGAFYCDSVDIDMTTAERQIWESGIITPGGKILLSHDNIAASGNGLWFHRPGQLMKWTGCSLVDAQDLSDICKVLETTESMTREFCRWATVRGISACLEYLKKFVSLDDVPDLVEIEEDGFPLEDDYFGLDLDDFADPRFDWNWEPPARETIYGASATDWHIARQYKFDGTEIQEVFLDDTKPDWVFSQPDRVQCLIVEVKNISNLDDLNGFTKRIQNSKTLSVVQGRVLHSYIRAARSRLEKPSALARTIIERIKQCPKEQLGYKAKEFYGMVQDGRIKLSINDQKMVWKVYNKCKNS